MASALLAAIVGPASVSAATPTASNVTAVLIKDQPLTTNLITDLGCCTDADGLDTLHLANINPVDPAFGTITATFPSNGTFTFTPTTGFTGTVPWTTYTISDGIRTKSARLTFIVDAPPIAENVTLTAIAGEDLAITPANILAGASDAYYGTLTVKSIDTAGATGGTLDAWAAGTTFHPAGSTCGAAAGGFDYTVTDGYADATAHVTINIDCKPTCDDAVTTIATDGAASGNDACTDAYMPVTGFALTQDATKGTLGFNTTTGAWTYMPVDSGSFVDTFKYTATDGLATSNVATVTINVDDAPACTTPGTVVADSGALKSSSVTCTDPNGDTLTYSKVTNVGHGTLVFSADGTFSYTSNAGYSGSDSFTFKASDWLLDSSTITVTISVLPANNVPACANVSTSTNEDTAKGGTFACTDVDGPQTLVYSKVASPSHGTATVTTGGAWTYTPTANYSGSDSFTYRAFDGTAYSVTRTVTISVAAVNDAPTLAGTVTVTEATAKDVTSSILALANDVDGNTLSVTAASSLTGGTVSFSAGHVTFTPTAKTCGATAGSFRATVSDGILTATATLTVNIVCVLPTVSTPAFNFAATGSVDETAPLTLTYGATDASGIAAYEVQVKVGTAAFAAVYTGTATSVTRSYAFNTDIQFRVRAKDYANNWSAWKTSVVHRIEPHQAEAASGITYTGTWTTYLNSVNSGTGYKYTSGLGSQAQLSWTGYGIVWVSPKSTFGGYTKVYADGVQVGRYTSYNSTTLYGQILARQTSATSSTHTLKIANDEAGKRTSLDVFLVLK